MKTYIKESTRITPRVSVNYETGKVEIEGRSSPENTMEFYAPFMRAILMLAKTRRKNIEVDFKLLYFNTSTARCIYLIIKQLKKLQGIGRNITINWFAEEDDEDMMETGVDFQEIVDIEFNIVVLQPV